MNWIKRAFSLLVALVVVMIAVSCTTERDAVDKSPELSLDKRLFEGEFFLRQTVFDLPYTADYAFIGESSDGKIIKWKITENWLVAYSIWDKLSVVDTNETVDVNETPVYAYPIAMHYDIVPSENPTTGEALPVLSINMDRPWNERRYFQLATNTRSGVNNYELKYMAMTQEWDGPFYRAGLTTGTDWEFYSHDGTFIAPKKYREYTAIADDKERFNKEVEWFQFYSTEYFQPVNNWDSVYTMEDVEEFIGNEPATIKYRFVFTKVNRDVVGKRDYDLATKSYLWKNGSKDNGFRPLEFRDELFREYGFFTNTFRGYDNYHGYKMDNVHIFANYWNMAWANEKKEWNFKCGNSETYNDCLKKVKYQQKIVYVSSPKTPLRIIPINCAITKDYNHAMLASRYAAMNPGSDPRQFEKWYVDNYDKDFFTEINGQKVRDQYWYLGNLPEDWEEKCFVPEEYAWIQRWDGSFIDENTDGTVDSDMEKILEEYKNDLVVMVKNHVEAYIPARDGKALYGFDNYYNLSNTSRENAAKICVNPEEAAKYREDVAMQFSTCVTNDEGMTTLYVDESGRAEWRGDRWSCKVYAEDDECPEGTVEAKAACVLNEERSCEIEDGVPTLRYKYDNGNPKAALINWVEKPTDYGILGVSQWNVNPETGMSISGGSNIAGSVLAWATERAVEMARMVISKDDPAAWDFEDLLNPDYAQYPEVAWNNKPSTIEPKSLIGSKRLENSFSMINKPSSKLNAKLPIELQQNVFDEIQEKFDSKTKMYNRFDFADVKDSKWENDMVPYSIKKSLFPWADPAMSPTYSDAEKEIMQPWFGGPEMMNAALLRFTDARARDFDYDESFMDGTIVNFIKAKQIELREKITDWNKPSGQDKYEQALIYSIYDELEKLMYKGVAQHEMGHTMGLRHNFAGSTDKNNYIDGFFRTENYPTLEQEIEEHVRTRVAESANSDDLKTIGDEVWRIKRRFESEIGYYMYNSVMDYQREAYIHANGLGKYDLAALKFVYGRSIEQYKIAGDAEYGEIVFDGDENDPNPELANKERDPNYADFVRVNTPFIDEKTGKLAKVEKPRELFEYYDESGKKVMRIGPRYKRSMLGRILTKDDVSLNSGGTPLFEHDCDGSDPDQYYCEPDTTYLVNDGSHYKYVFVSDEKSREEPAGNTFDGGYSGADIIRQMTDMDHMFYYLRYFQRGNPRFRDFRGRNSMNMILGSLLRQYVFVHFLLDYNFYIYGKWFSSVPLFNDTPETPRGCISTALADDPSYGQYVYTIPLDETTFLPVENHMCEDLSRALAGNEYWIDKFDNVRSVTPFGAGDHVIAGMKGIQYLLFDSMYRPNKGKYVRQLVKTAPHFERFGYDDCNQEEDCQLTGKTGKYFCNLPTLPENAQADYCDFNKCCLKIEIYGKENNERSNYEVRNDVLEFDQDQMYVSMDNYIPGIEDETEIFGFDSNIIDVPASIGRYHRDRFDIQDNPGIYYDKVIRRGYAPEKMVTLFTLSNSGWLDGKYSRESRANGLSNMFPGLENVIFNVLSDIATEESVMSFTPYCIDTYIGGKVTRVNLPVNLLTNFGAAPEFWTGSEEDAMYDPSRNICSKVDKNDPSRYVPVHAGWIYFDKMWPNYWAMGNLANISADTSVLRRWTSNFIPRHERSLYAAVDVNEEEFLNKDENGYYRARIPASAMDNADAYAYREWGKCREAILEADKNADVSGCITKAVWPVWKLKEFVLANNPSIAAIENPEEQEAAVDAEVERMQNDGEDLRFTKVEEFKLFLTQKYARYAPSFRIVVNAKLLKEKELLDASSGSREPYSRLEIMETTLDQLNSFAADQFGTAAFYVQRY